MRNLLFAVFDLLFYLAFTFSVYIMISVQFQVSINVLFIVYDILLILYIIIIPKFLGVRWYNSIEKVGDGYRYAGGLILIAIAVYVIYF